MTSTSFESYIASLPRIDNHAHPVAVDAGKKVPLVAALAGLADSEDAMRDATTSIAYRRALKVVGSDLVGLFAWSAGFGRRNGTN